MDICYRAVEKTREVYDYMNTLRFPYRYGADFADWESRMTAMWTAKGGGCFRGWRRSARIAQVGWRGLSSMVIPQSALTKAAQ